MTRPISASAVAAIEAAMACLAATPDAGQPLTVARLASEAGPSRATLYRAPDLLRRFREAATVPRQAAPSPGEPDRVLQLEAEVAVLRGRETDELRALRAANRHMAQHVQALSLLVLDQERQIARFQAEPSASGSRRPALVLLTGEPPL
jgi:hypothetical protein